MIGSSLRTTVLLPLALAVSAALAGCGGTSTAASAPSGPATSTSPPAPASPVGAAASSAPATAAGSASGPAGGTTAPAPATSAPAAPASAGDCPALALVRTTLGLSVGAPAANASVEDVVVCSYPKDGNPAAVVVRVQEGQTTTGFAAAKAGFARSGQKTVDVPDMFDGAYRSELGTEASGVTRTLVVLRGSTEVLVSARAPFDGLTRLTHTMLD